MTFDRYRASGLSARRFAGERGINYHTLNFNIRKERQESDRTEVSKRRFVPITIPDLTDAGEPAEITIQIGKVTLRIGVEG